MTTLQINLLRFSFVITSFIYLPAFAQLKLYGKVVDEKTNEPVAGARLYFNCTSISTISGEEGEFSFDLQRDFNTELIVFSPGYDLVVFKPLLNQGKKYVLKLQQKPAVHDSLITDEKVRKALLDIFSTDVLGISEEATKATISNPRHIFFSVDSNNIFSAVADTPIVIINTMLGYKINLDLGEFSYSNLTGRYVYHGFVQYDTIANGGDQSKYLSNRSHCYYGSSMHFYRSLTGNNLLADEFAVFLVQSDSALKKNRKLNHSKGLQKYIPLTAQELLYIDSANNFMIRAEGQLLVQYYKNPFSRTFMEHDILVIGLLDKGIENFLTFKSLPVGINNVGVLSDPETVLYDGYWLYEGLCNKLPFDYQTE